MIPSDLVDLSRLQFALTAMYHFIFVPLTLGLSFMLVVMELAYVISGKQMYKDMTRFWGKLFGINFAIGVATGLTMEFQFGTNWAYYSHYVGDIFGAPLAIEGLMAFFLESTFIGLFFFGWDRLSKGKHLAATILMAVGSNLSALWILVANAWMQHPVGMEFNPDTVRNEMVDFWAVATSPVAVNKFFHTVLSGWVLGAIFVVGISCWYLLKKRNREFALASIKIGAIFGLVASLLSVWTGDGSGYQIAQTQPMKLAAVEGLYEGGTNVGLVGIGVLNPEKKTYNDGKDPFLFRFEIPSMLSFLAERNVDGYVPGITNIIEGGYQQKDGSTALSAAEKIERGKTAIGALAAYRAAKSAGHEEDAQIAYKVLQENIPYFGYGYIDSVEQLIPHVPFVFYSFHIMIILGGYFLLFFIFILVLSYKEKLQKLKWVLWIAVLTIPLGYVCLESGWIVAEMGRQPWVIQDIMPTFAAISNIEVASVQTTFWMFAVLFTVLLIAEVGIMLKQIKKGTEQK